MYIIQKEKEGNWVDMVQFDNISEAFNHLLQFGDTNHRIAGNHRVYTYQDVLMYTVPVELNANIVCPGQILALPQVEVRESVALWMNGQLTWEQALAVAILRLCGYSSSDTEGTHEQPTRNLREDTITISE